MAKLNAQVGDWIGNDNQQFIVLARAVDRGGLVLLTLGGDRQKVTWIYERTVERWDESDKGDCAGFEFKQIAPPMKYAFEMEFDK